MRTLTDTTKPWWAVSEHSRKGRAHLWRISRNNPLHVLSYCGKGEYFNSLQDVGQALVGCKICQKSKEST